MPHRNSAQQAILQGQLSNPYLAVETFILVSQWTARNSNFINLLHNQSWLIEY